jgi:hypothetical protein
LVILEDIVVGLFNKARAATSQPAAKSSRSTTWVVTDGKVGEAVHELTVLAAQEKAIAAKKKLFATVVARHAKDEFVSDFCDLGVPPATPMVVQNHDGEKVTYVVQDRGGQYNVKDEQKDVLRQLLGDDRADSLLYSEVTFGFDRTIFALPEVAEYVEKALEQAVADMIKNEVLSADQADQLISAKEKTSFRPGTLDRAADICGKDKVKLEQFLDAMGSSCTRYVKC